MKEINTSSKIKTKTIKVKQGKTEKELFEKIEISTNFFQVYEDAQYAFFEIQGSCGKDFLMYILSIADTENIFYYGKDELEDFNKRLAKATEFKIHYSESGVKKVIRKLIDKGVIARIKRGKYKLNPYISWRNNTNDRIKQIKVIENNNYFELKNEKLFSDLPKRNKRRIEYFDEKYNEFINNSENEKEQSRVAEKMNEDL